jgi:hypothetical protein
MKKCFYKVDSAAIFDMIESFFIADASRESILHRV